MRLPKPRLRSVSRRFKVLALIAVVLVGLFGGAIFAIYQKSPTIPAVSGGSFWVDAKNRLGLISQRRTPLLSVIQGCGGAKEVEWENVPSTAKIVLDCAWITVTPNMDGRLEEIQFTATRTVMKGSVAVNLLNLPGSLGTAATTLATKMSDLGLPVDLKAGQPRTIQLKLRDNSVADVDATTGEIVRMGLMTTTYQPWADMDAGTYMLNVEFKATKLIWTPSGQLRTEHTTDQACSIQHRIVVGTLGTPVAQGKLIVKTSFYPAEMKGMFSLRYVVPSSPNEVQVAPVSTGYSEVLLPAGTNGEVIFGDVAGYLTPSPVPFLISANGVVTVVGQYTPTSTVKQVTSGAWTLRCKGLYNRGLPGDTTVLVWEYSCDAKTYFGAGNNYFPTFTVTAPDGYVFLYWGCVYDPSVREYDTPVRGTGIYVAKLYQEYWDPIPPTATPVATLSYDLQSLTLSLLSWIRGFRRPSLGI